MLVLSLNPAYSCNFEVVISYQASPIHRPNLFAPLSYTRESTGHIDLALLLKEYVRRLTGGDQS